GTPSMSRTTYHAPVTRFGREPGTFTVTYDGRPSGVLLVRFHGIDRATVSDQDSDGILCGRFRYRVRLHFVRTADGWSVDDIPGLPSVYRTDAMWTRPAPTIDRL